MYKILIVASFYVMSVLAVISLGCGIAYQILARRL